MKPLSKLEETLALYIRCENLPEPEREYLPIPGRKYRYDFCWPDKKLAVDVQGGIWMRKSGHNTGRSIQDDCEKQALATLAGWRAIAVTEKQIQDGSAVEWIKSLLTDNNSH